MNLRRALLSATLAALVAPSVGEAQGGRETGTPVSAAAEQRIQAQLDAAHDCMRHIPATEMTRVIVYVSADVAADSRIASDADVAEAQANADALASAVADRMRARFGVPPGVLPSGDSLMTWIGFGPDLEVVARRGRSLHWTFNELGEVSDGTGLIARGLADAVADGETFVWPDSLRVDSLLIRMRLHAPAVARDGTAEPIRSHAAVAVFSLPVPWEERPEPLDPPHVDVERGWLDGPLDGFVELGVIVDTTGHVDPGVIRELAPLDDHGRPVRSLSRVWKAARASAMTVRFRPHRIGGCTIPTPYPMVMPFTMR